MMWFLQSSQFSVISTTSPGRRLGNFSATLISYARSVSMPFLCVPCLRNTTVLSKCISMIIITNSVNEFNCSPYESEHTCWKDHLLLEISVCNLVAGIKIAHLTRVIISISAVATRTSAFVFPKQPTSSGVLD